MKRAPIKQLPSRDELLRLFSYDLATGDLRWRVRSGPRAEGQRAGTVNWRGYLVVGIDHIYYYTGRIIWKIMTGNDPEVWIDHIDGDRTNNKWVNLRLATNGQNLHNSKLRSDNKSGVKGVHWDVRHKKWRAIISVNKQHIRLGRFNTINEAEMAILSERAKLHGEFARAM
jgi:hypothetical protein